MNLEHFRSYLLLLARIRLDRRIQSKVDASDIVQQTMLEAHQAIESLRGENSAVQAAWLRQILARNLSNAVRDLTREKRDVAREQQIQIGLEESSCQLENWLAGKQSTPSETARRHEHALLVADALAKLPKQQSEALTFRYFQGCSLAEVAEQMNTTVAAVAGLLQRGLKNLRRSLGALEGI